MPSAPFDLSLEYDKQSTKTCYISHPSSSFPPSSSRLNTPLLPPQVPRESSSGLVIRTPKKDQAIQHDAFFTRPCIVDVPSPSTWQSHEDAPVSSLAHTPNILNHQYSRTFPTIANANASLAPSHPFSPKTRWTATSSTRSTPPPTHFPSQFQPTPSRRPFKRASTIVHHLKSRWSHSTSRLKRSTTLECTATQEYSILSKKTINQTEDLVTNFGAYRLRID